MTKTKPARMLKSPLTGYVHVIPTENLEQYKGKSGAEYSRVKGSPLRLDVTADHLRLECDAVQKTLLSLIEAAQDPEHPVCQDVVDFLRDRIISINAVGGVVGVSWDEMRGLEDVLKGLE